MTVESEKIKIASRGYADPVFFCRYFLPHLFPTEMPWVHRGLLAILRRQCEFLGRYGELEKICKNFVVTRPDGTTEAIFSVDMHGRVSMDLRRFTEIVLPRGFSKTTIVNADQIFNVCYFDILLSVFVSAAGPHAEMQLNNIKRELTGNAKLIEIFGDLRPARNEDGSLWRQDFIETRTGVAIAARGAGAQIRGFNHRFMRPKRIVLDDVEDEESVRTPEQRDKKLNWLTKDVMPAIDEMDPAAHIIMLGTILGRETLLTTMRKSPEWSYIHFGALDLDGDPLWPLRLDHAGIEAKKRAAAAVGKLANFYLEYFNTHRADEEARFKPENIKYGEPPHDDPILIKALFLDPAISDKVGADTSAAYVVGRTNRGHIYVLDNWRKQGATPREQMDGLFRLQRVHQPQRVGIESNAYQAALVHFCREEMFRKRQYFEITPVTHTKKKVERIEGILQPRYAAGYVTHVRQFPALEQQLLDFNPKVDNIHDDDMDALAGAIALLDGTEGLLDTSTADEYSEPIPLKQLVGGDFRSAP